MLAFKHPLVVNHILRGTEHAAQCSAFQTYVNSPIGRLGNQAKYYTDFSFSYPASWFVVDMPSNPSNYVEVRRFIEGEVVEWFAVGSLGDDGVELTKHLPTIIELTGVSLRTQLPNYRELSRGETQLGASAAYQLLIEHTGTTALPAKKTFWQRVVALAHPETQTGVVLVMGATNASPDITHAQDLGVVGGGQVITYTFKLGS